VVLLEARDRLGGRTWNRTLPGTDVSVEYGGAWFWTDGHPALASEIDRYGLELDQVPTPDTVSWVTRGGRVAGSDAVEALRTAMASADHVLEPVLARVASDWSPERRSSLRDLDVPFAPWLRSLGLQADVEDFLLAFCAAMGGGDPEDQSALAILADAVNTGYRFEEAFTDIGQSLSRGTKSLLDAIAADARADVRLGSVARRIRSDDGGAHVDLDSGGTLSASATVVALPLNVWRDLAFDPPLSEDKRWAASTGHAGTSTKVLAIARGVPEAFEGVGWPSTLQALVAGREVDGGRLVTGFSGVRGIDPTDPFAVDKALKEYLPESEVVLSDGHDWNADPFSRGAWFTPRPGWDTRGGEPLTTPEGRLAFATSDVAPSGAGWIEGAIVAGRDAARDTLSMLERSV
jgi:monoamine oxidase